MRAVSILLALAVAVQNATEAPTLRDLIGKGFSIRITTISDGDTVEGVPEGDKRAIRIRIFGIDAPERGEPFSQQARTSTRILLLDQHARAIGKDVDRYGRLVAILHVGGVDASESLLKAGLACHYTAYSSDRALASAEAEARQARRGFWASSARRPRCAATNANVPPADVEKRVAGSQTVLHGNTESHVYHTSSCRNFNCQKCTRVFASEVEAKAAGFRPARDCH